ncbi:MAG: prepilin-type N-terminal cleavage/methylation domain-containing protein [Planctomycetota bacterium]
MRRTSIEEVTHKKNASKRQAFTLIELMIVVVIIATLMGLLLPAVMSAFGSAKVAEVASEIRGLEAAIAQFKSIYGIEPPSRIRLFNTSAGWSTTMMGTFVQNGVTLSHDRERTRSIGLINRMWPNFDFTIPHTFGPNPYTDLSGSECLVFFLGGVGTGSSGAYAMTGFSKNPANPFATISGNESREGPFFEFKQSRLRPSLNTTNTAALVYVDPISGQTAPYAYTSSNDGRGYESADLYVNSADDLNDVYRAAPGGTTAIAQKPKTCQIISPGIDGAFGAGGYFNPTAANHGLSNPKDYDNLTNFHGGYLNK